jgi:uncharacterized protein (UPF0333 family)
MPMSKVKLAFAIIIAVIVLAGSNVATWYFSRCPKIVEVVAHEAEAPVYYKPVEVVQSSGAGVITIEGAMIKGNVFAVVARNNLMSVTRKFDIIIPKQVVRHYGLSLGYGVMYDIDSRAFRHNVDANYLYSFGRVFIGGGAAFQFDRDRLYQAGPRISAGFTF